MTASHWVCGAAKPPPNQPMQRVVYWALAARDDRYLTDVYRWLDKAYEERTVVLVQTSARWYDGYQFDPGWIAFRKKLRLPP